METKQNTIAKPWKPRKKTDFYFNKGERTILRDRAYCGYTEEVLMYVYGADLRLSHLSDKDKKDVIAQACREAISLIKVEKNEIRKGGLRDLLTVNWLTFWALHDFIDGSTYDIEESLFWSAACTSSCLSKLNNLASERTEAGTL